MIRKLSTISLLFFGITIPENRIFVTGTCQLSILLMNLIDETVGQNIRQFRERLGFTQASVADFLGISREQISYYETSARAVSTDHLQKLADLFGIDAYDLLDPDSFQRQINVALAFRADQFTAEDLTSIAAFKRIVKNYRKMKLRIANGE